MFGKLSKGINPLVSAVFILVISMAGIALVMNIGMPAIDRAQENALYDEARRNMGTLDETLDTVKYGGEGTSRTVSIDVGGGEYIVDNTDDTVKFRYDMDTDFLPPEMCLSRGNILTRTFGSGRLLDLRLDEGEGNKVYDCSFYNNHGSTTGGINWTDSRYGKSLNITNSSHVEISDDDSLKPERGISVSVWFKEGGSGDIVKKSDGSSGYSLSVSGENMTFEWSVYDEGQKESVTADTDFDEGQWVFLTGTWDGNEIELYIDSRRENSSLGGMAHADDPICVGCGEFAGILDNIRIYDRQLTTNEVENLYQRQSIGESRELVMDLQRDRLNFTESMRLSTGTHNLLIANRGYYGDKAEIEIRRL